MKFHKAIRIRSTYSNSSSSPRIVGSGIWVTPLERITAGGIVGLLALLVPAGQAVGASVGRLREVARLLGRAENAFPAEARGSLGPDSGRGLDRIYVSISDRVEGARRHLNGEAISSGHREAARGRGRGRSGRVARRRRGHDFCLDVKLGGRRDGQRWAALLL